MTNSTGVYAPRGCPDCLLFLVKYWMSRATRILTPSLDPRCMHPIPSADPRCAQARHLSLVFLREALSLYRVLSLHDPACHDQRQSGLNSRSLDHSA
jgi:hypothetical protein